MYRAPEGATEPPGDARRRRHLTKVTEFAKNLSPWDLPRHAILSTDESARVDAAIFTSVGRTP